MKKQNNKATAKKTTTKAEKPADKTEEKKKPGFSYDESKDEVIKDYGTIKGDNTRVGDISVRVVAYNGGKPKLALMRTGLNKADEPWFSPRLGRITQEELEALWPMLEKARKRLSKATATE